MNAATLTTAQVVRATGRAVLDDPVLLAALAFGIPLVERAVEQGVCSLTSVDGMSNTWTPPWLLLSLATTGYQHAAIALVVARSEKERREPVGALLRRAVTRTATTLLTLLYARLIVAIGLLFVAPALIALAATFVAAPIAASEGLSVAWAIQRSRLVTRGATYALIGATFIGLLVVVITYVAIIALVGLFTSATFPEAALLVLLAPTPMLAAAGAVGQGVAVGVSAIAGAAVYRDIAKPAAGAMGERIARVFE